MKWSVQQLLANKEKGLHIDTSLDVSDLTRIDQEIRHISPVSVTGTGHITNKSVTFQLTIKGEMILPCARTLNDVEFPFSIEATEIFSFYGDAILDEEDNDVHEVEGNTVDLIPYVKEQILLEKPFRVFSDESEGPVPQSGANWELITKDEEKQRIDPRLKQLEKFFQENNDMD